jgi:hypothetical protein
MDNQGQNRPGHFQLTTSATPPSGYRNIGKYIDVRKGIIDNGTTVVDIGGNGGISTGGSYTGSFANRITIRTQRREGTAIYPQFPASRVVYQNQRTRGTARSIVYYTSQFSGSVATSSSIINQYYLHVKI